jgi:F-type H+-transporting ATPase subunit b
MTIDWLTVGAQVLNFLVLVYLLKRFLYGPVVRAMARREAAIAERLREARQRQEDAGAEARRHHEARAELEAQRERLLARAREEADDLRRTLEKDVRREMDGAREQWRAALELERAAFFRDVRRQVAGQFEALARRALGDLASAGLETQMAEVLVERLGALDGDRRAALARASASAEPLRVRSAFELPAEVRRRLTSALRDASGQEVEVTYERADDVVCGVEIRAGGESLAWSLERYLDDLERRLAEALGRPAPGRNGDSPGDRDADPPVTGRDGEGPR